MSLLELLTTASFMNLGAVYLGPGHFTRLSPVAYLGLMAAGAVWLAAAGWIAYRVMARHARRGREARGLFLGGLILYGAAGGYVTLVYPPTTDEPHYLMISESLLADGDLELSGNYAAGEYRKFFPNAAIDPHTVIMPDGRMYSQHTAGLPLAILPGYAFAGRWGATGILAVIAAALLASLYRLCLAAGSPRSPAFAACAVMGATAPLLFASTLVFTEVAAALLVATALLNGKSAAKPAACAAILPWLHPRFALISAGLMALDLAQSPRRERMGRGMVWIAVCGAGAGLFLCVYHGPALTAVLNVLTEKYPSRLEDLTAGSLVSMSFGNPVAALLGKLFDRDFGIIPYSPWLLVLVPGIFAARGIAGRWFLVSGLAYFLATLVFRNWGGSAYPGRTVVPLLPYLAPWLAYGINWAREKPFRRRTTAVLAAFSVGTGWLLTACPVLRYTSGRDWLAGKLGRGWHAVPQGWFPSLDAGLDANYWIGIMFVAVALSVAWIMGTWAVRLLAGRR